MFENVTLVEFLNHDGSDIADIPNYEDPSIYHSMLQGRMVEITSKLEFTFFLIKPKSGSIVVHASGATAGVFYEDNLLVSSEFERCNLATALVLYAYENGYQIMGKRKLSCGGQAALTKAWKVGRRECAIAWWPAGSKDEDI